MKQHITLQQWNELNKKEDKALGDWYVKIAGKNRLPVYEFFTIGRLIQFLGEDLDGIIRHSRGLDGYDVLYLEEPLESEIFFEKELVDALWEACKYKLKNK